MEFIYKPRSKININIKNYFTNFRDNLIPDDVQLNLNLSDSQNNDLLETRINFHGTSEEFMKLQKSICIDTMLSEDDEVRQQKFDPSDPVSRRRPYIEMPKKALQLSCIRNYVKAHSVENESTAANKSKLKQYKYSKYKYLKLQTTSGEPDLTPLNEILITVRIYEPFIYKYKKYTTTKPRFCQEFYVLGSQLLTELRDKIYCQCSFGPFYDISENPFEVFAKEQNQQSEQIEEQQESPVDDAIVVDDDTTTDDGPVVNKHIDPGFFFITNTFYNDFRNTKIDYSKIIREWCNKQECIGELQRKSMDRTKFEDLTVQLGYPQLYQHHGNCEHLFTISDIRLLNKSDCLNRSAYPMLKVTSAARSVFCNICGNCEASVVVRNSKHHIHDPSFLCYECFISYHYIDRKKIGEFEAYRYYGNKPITVKNK